MSLDGLRAWIGEVERKLGKRTRVFLALCAIAIGIAGAAVYLALDARSDSVSEGDVQELQQELESQGAGGADSADLVQLEAEVESLQTEVERLRGNGGNGGSGKANQGGASGEQGGAGDAGGGAATPSPDSSDGAELQKLLEEAKRQSEAGGQTP